MNVTSNIDASGSFLNHFVTFGVNTSEVVGDQATKLQNVIDTFKGAETAAGSGVADARSHPDAGRAHRPREHDRRPGSSTRRSPSSARAASRTS